MIFNSSKYLIKLFLFLVFISNISQTQFIAAPHKFIPRNNLIEQLIQNVDDKLIIFSDLLEQVKKFKEYAHTQELEKLNNKLMSATEEKVDVEKGLEQIKKLIDTVNSEITLDSNNNEIIARLNAYIRQLDEKIDELTVFINKFDQVLQNKKRVLTQINSTANKIAITKQKCKNIKNKVDINSLCNKLQFTEKKQETAKKEYEKNNILLALNYTLKARNFVNEIYQKINSIENSHLFKKRIIDFLEYTDDMIKNYGNTITNNASPSIVNKFNTAQHTQENAYLTVEKNPETAMYMARQARRLILDLNGFYEEDIDDYDTISENQPVSMINNFEKVSSTDKADISWNISTSGNAFYNKFASDQYIYKKNDMSYDNRKLDSAIQEYTISGYLTASLNWYPNIPIIHLLKPNITLSQSRCNLGNDITLEFFNNLLTIDNRLLGAFLLNQKLKDTSNSVFCEMEVELQKNFPIFSFDIVGDFKLEEFILPHPGYVPYKIYSFNTDFNFNTKDLSKSFLLGFTCSFNDYHNSGNSSLLERDHFLYEPRFKICFWSSTNNLIFDGFYNWQSFKPSQISKGYLYPAEIQNGKLETYLISQPFQSLNIELKGYYDFKNTLFRDKECNPSISDSIHLISKENQYLHTYSLGPDITIKPYSSLGLSLLFEYERQKYKITPVIDTLHTLKSYYAIIQGMRLFYETRQNFFQISYYFKMNNITQRGEYNSESNYWELKLPFKWNWNPFEWLTVDLETEFRYRKKNKGKTQKLKPEKSYSISLYCGVQL